MTKIILVANTDWYLFNFRLSLARFLRNQGWEVLFVSPAGRFVEKIEQQRFRWIPWNLGRKTVTPWRELPSLLELGRIYCNEKADLIHQHTIKPVIYGSLAARLAGKPALVNSITGRGYVFRGDDKRAAILRWMVKPLYKLALSLPNCALVFENENDRRYFIQQGLVPAQQTWLIEGVGVDEDVFSPLPEPVGEPVVLMAARLLWDKGLGVLVEAARLLHQRVRVRVVLVGSPDPGNPKSVKEDTLRGWHEEGVIEWWGWQDDMQQVYSRCHIVVLPTMYGEGVPTTLLEAAACARPLVATDIPGCRAIVEDGKNGFLVQPDDPQGLADAIERLVIDPQLRLKMGLAGRQFVVDKYTKVKINIATFSVYQTLLNSGK